MEQGLVKTITHGYGFFGQHRSFNGGDTENHTTKSLEPPEIPLVWLLFRPLDDALAFKALKQLLYTCSTSVLGSIKTIYI